MYKIIRCLAGRSGLGLALIVALTSGQPIFGQQPLLLESVEQSYDYTKDTFETQSTTTYAYDSEYRLINKTRKGPELCLDCDEYMQAQLASETENWTYNSSGRETYYSDVVKLWRKNEPQNPWELQTTRIDTRKTTFNEDTLVLEKVVSTENPPSDWQSSYLNRITETYQYNSQRQMTLYTNLNETTSSSYASGKLTRTNYTYQNDLLTAEHNSTRSFSKSDTIDFTNTAIAYSHNSNNQLQTKETDYDYNGSRYKSRQVFFYNAAGRVIRDDNYYFNTAISDWTLAWRTEYEYYDGGIIKKEIMRSIASDNSSTVTTTDYNETGKQVFSKKELYNDQMVLVSEYFHTTTEWINNESSRTTSQSADGFYSFLFLIESNASGKPLVQRYETQNYSADSSFLQSSLTQTVYEYDNGGDLVRTRETRVAYDADSLIMRGCCGFLYEAESLFTSRCDGISESKARRQYNYVAGTEGDIEPYPMMSREYYTYTPSWCDEEEELQNQLIVYPNPSTGSVNITSDLLTIPQTRLTLITSDGKLMSQMPTPITTNMTIDLTTTAPGLYIIKLENGSSHAEERVVVIP